MSLVCLHVFFFKQKTAYEMRISDWSSDVCSSDLIHVMARTDDVINVAGHRLSTGAMEEVLAAHPDVAACAVIGVADPLKGQLQLGLQIGSAAGREGVCQSVYTQGVAVSVQQTKINYTLYHKPPHKSNPTYK